MKQLIPDTLTNRTLLVLILGLMISHTLSVALYSIDRTSALTRSGAAHIGEHIITISRLVDDAPQPRRQRIVELIDGLGLHIAWGWERALGEAPANSSHTDATDVALFSHLSNESKWNFRIRDADPASTAIWREHFKKTQERLDIGNALLVAMQLRDKSWLNFVVPLPSSEPFWSFRFVLSTLVMLAAVCVSSVLMVRNLTRPFVNLAAAARRLGTDVKAPPLSEDGPSEVRYAAIAFNEMQARIRRFVDDRTQLLAAIAHDLGTPITRLRLRAELIEDVDQQRKVLSDLDDMQNMVTSALSFARGESSDEPRAKVDLNSLLLRIRDDMLDAGHSISLITADSSVPYLCRPVAMRRALTNIVDNAIRYGTQAHISMQNGRDAIFIQIDDDGPGIPEFQREQAFLPFQRLETSRNRETGGSGLGLTVARTIIRGHGGEVTLEDRDGGGLRVEIELPR